MEGQSRDTQCSWFGLHQACPTRLRDPNHRWPIRRTTMNNTTNPFIVSDGIGSTACVVQHPTTSYTVLADDNVIICGADSLAITLTATSNSPVFVTAADSTTVRSGCTVVVGTQDFAIGTN